MTRSIKILYWNARSFRKRKNEIYNVLTNIDVLVCVESWLDPSVINLHFPGFVSYRIDRSHSKGGGIFILIRNSIAYKELKDLNSPDISLEIGGIKITNAIPTFNLIVCYRSPGLTLSLEQWDQITANIR